MVEKSYPRDIIIISYIPGPASMFIGNGRSNGGTRRHLERSIFDHFRRQLYAISSRLMRPSSDARQTSPTRPTSRVFESSKCRLLSLRLHRREMTLRGAPQTEWSVRSSFSNKLIWPVKRWSNETLSPLPPYCRILLFIIFRLILYTNFSFKINVPRSFSIMILTWNLTRNLTVLLYWELGLRNEASNILSITVLSDSRARWRGTR